MKHSKIWLASCALCAVAGMAQADCADELAQFTDAAEMTTSTVETEPQNAEGISKDGSLAPLEVPASDDAQTESSDVASASSEPEAVAGDTTEGIAKDGSLAPLENTEAEPGTAVAMSGSDVQAQQEGDPTAAEEAETATPEPDRNALIAEAQTALTAGDEAACQAAVDQLSAM